MDNFFLSVFDWGDYDKLTCSVKEFGMTVKIVFGIFSDCFIRLVRKVEAVVDSDYTDTVKNMCGELLWKI